MPRTSTLPSPAAGLPAALAAANSVVLKPAEQARIVQLLVERVDVRMAGMDIRLRANGLCGLVLEVVGTRRAVA
jgi:delta 1-pyrroline-5-carboxylate dehydrogenase